MNESAEPAAATPAEMPDVIGGLGDYLGRSVTLYLKSVGNWILIGLVGSLALGVGSWGGFHNCVLKALRGEQPQVGDVLMPFSRFVDFFVPVLLIGIGFCFCLIPGLVLASWWFFIYPLMIERNIGWREATRLSKGVAQQKLLAVFVVLLVAGVVAGLLSFVTAPIEGMVAVLCYKHVFEGSIPEVAKA
jgi:hypothetical protein